MVNDALVAAHEMRDLFTAHRHETENASQLAPATVDALIESKLCRDVYTVLQPFWLERAGRVRPGLEPTEPIFAE